MCMEVLVAFSTIYQCAVFMYCGVGIPVVYMAGENGDLPRVDLQCSAGIHFNPLYKISAYVPPKPVAKPDTVAQRPTVKKLRN